MLAPVAEPTGSTRTLSVPLRRLEAWLSGFETRHGPLSVPPSSAPPAWRVVAADGSEALVHAPQWLAHVHAEPGPDPRALADLRPVFAVLLVRRAGYAVACFAGSQQLDAKVGRRHIHGRTAAGGWSQQRYARRRGNQADELAEAVTAHADRIIAARPSVAFLVTGGDRPLLAKVLRGGGARLAGLPVGGHLGIGTPDATVLAGVPDRVLAVQVDLRELPAP